jgi:hypothetical protein
MFHVNLLHPPSAWMEAAGATKIYYYDTQCHIPEHSNLLITRKQGFFSTPQKQNTKSSK